MKSYIITLVISVSMFVCLHAQDISELQRKEFADITVYHSIDFDTQANMLGALVAGANRYFASSLDNLEISFQLLVLSESDWPVYTYPNLIYGMPHYKGDGITLVVAAEDNTFWRMQVPNPASIDPYFGELINQHYNINGTLSGRPFFDLLAIHELGHAWNSAGGLNTQRLWLSELFCNIMLHTFIAERRPDLLGGLETLPSFWANSDSSNLKFTTLTEFEENYRVLGQDNPFNYGWYQFRFHNTAKLIYDEAGPETLKKLWDFMKANQVRLSDEDLAIRLEDEVHPIFADLIYNW